MAGLNRLETSGGANPVLDVFIKTSTGTSFDPYSLEYVIYDVSTPTKQATPVQVFPASGRSTVDLTDYPTGQRLGLGHFVADWTVPDTEPIGSHRIVWWFRKTAIHAENTYQEEFEVLPDPTVSAPPGGFYASIDDIRALGIDVTLASDIQVEIALKTATQVIDRITRQWFAPRELTFQVDGNNSDTLHLSIPIISIDYVKLNSATVESDLSLFAIYNANPYPDDRRNPRIKLKRGSSSVFQTPSPFAYPQVFRKGYQNQEIKGTFGYVEADGSIPELIQKACRKLAVMYLTMPEYVPAGMVAPQGPPPGAVGSVMKEITDGHSIQYTFVKFSDVRAGFSGITMDREILDILKIYRGPVGIAVPSGWR